jgi:2'-5' RNA ligase
MGHFMRLFIAINLSETMKAALVNAQNEMVDHGVRGSYTPEENLHLTLAFIGEVPDAEPVLEALSAVSFTPFELCLEGMGCFGDLWWAGMRKSAPLTTLARRIRHALAENGIPFDRKRFSPHITLIRKARGDMPGIRLDNASMTVNTVSLMRSDRGKNGMIYTELGKIMAEEASERNGGQSDGI